MSCLESLNSGYGKLTPCNLWQLPMRNLRHVFLALVGVFAVTLSSLMVYVLLVNTRVQPNSELNNQFHDISQLKNNLPRHNLVTLKALQQLHGRHSAGAVIDCSRKGHLLFKRDFSFPQPLIMKPLKDIDSSQWICGLRRYLLSYSSDKPVALVTSNMKYIDILLNWLISAVVRSEISLDAILVVSMEEKLHQLLVRRGIPSVFISPSMLFLQNTIFQQTFEQVMMLRLAIMRVINHFGFDVVMYDTDAIILKNPQPLFDQLPNDDIIGSVGKIPQDLVAEWGITICIGVVLVKSSPQTETYWNSMKDVCRDVLDDQGKLNCGLKALDIHWTNNDSSYQSTIIHGLGENRLSVSILPYDNICRQTTCNIELRDTYYIWHKGGQRTRRDKLRSAREGRTWFLQYKWDNIRNNLSGQRWLSSICYPGATHS